MKHPLPREKKSSDPFWKAATEQRLSLPHCPACDAFRWPPRDSCTGCGTPLGWRDSTGTGAVEVASVIRRAVIPDLKDSVPYCVGFVRLDDGPRLFGNILGAAPDTVAAGQRVRVSFEATSNSEISVPVFVLDGLHHAEERP